MANCLIDLACLPSLGSTPGQHLTALCCTAAAAVVVLRVPLPSAQVRQAEAVLAMYSREYRACLLRYERNGAACDQC